MNKVVDDLMKTSWCPALNLEKFSMSEIGSFVRRLQDTQEKSDDLLEEVQDMLIVLMRIIEEGHCHPFKI